MSMTTESPTPVSIDDDVDFITDQLGQLRELARQKDSDDIFDDEDVYDLSVRWGTALAGRLPRIAHYSAIGALTDADERRFQTLCDELRAASPMIERFKLTRPDLADCPDARANGRHHRKARKRKRFLRP